MFVGGLSDISDAEFRAHFMPYGTIVVRGGVVLAVLRLLRGEPLRQQEAAASHGWPCARQVAAAASCRQSTPGGASHSALPLPPAPSPCAAGGHGAAPPRRLLPRLWVCDL